MPRLSDTRFLQQAVTGPAPAPSPRDAAIAAMPHLRGIANQGYTSFQDVMSGFGVQAEMEPCESVSYVDPSSGVRRFGWLIPGGAKEGGLHTVAVDDGEYVLVPNEHLERTGRKTDEDRERVRDAVRGFMGTDSSALTYRADLQEMREPTPMGEPKSGGVDAKLVLQYNAMFGAPSDQEVRLFLAAKYPSARYLDAQAGIPGRMEVMVHLGQTGIAPVAGPGIPNNQKDYRREQQRYQQQAQEQQMQEQRAKERRLQQRPLEQPVSPASPGVQSPQSWMEPNRMGQFAPTTDGFRPYNQPRQPGAVNEELQGTGKFGSDPSEMGPPVNAPHMMDPSGGVQAPYSSGAGPLGVREDAPGDYRTAGPGEAGTPGGGAGSPAGVGGGGGGSMGPAVGGEVVETFDPSSVSTTSGTAAPPATPRVLGNRRAQLQTRQRVGDVAEALLKGSNTELMHQAIMGLVNKLTPGNMSSLKNQGWMKGLMASAVAEASRSNQPLFKAISNEAAKAMNLNKQPPVSQNQTVPGNGQAPNAQAYEQAKQKVIEEMRTEGLDPSKLTPQQMTQAINQELAQGQQQQQQPQPDPFFEAQQPEQVGQAPVAGHMASRRQAAPSNYQRYNLPPPTLDLHRMLRMDKMVRRGDYVVATVVWDPKDLEGMSAGGVKNSVLSYVKAQASYRDRQFDLGHIGRPRFLTFDMDAGMAELAIRSSNGQAFQEEVVIRQEPPPYRQRYV